MQWALPRLHIQSTFISQSFCCLKMSRSVINITTKYLLSVRHTLLWRRQNIYLINSLSPLVLHSSDNVTQLINTLQYKQTRPAAEMRCVNNSPSCFDINFYCLPIRLRIDSFAFFVIANTFRELDYFKPHCKMLYRFALMVRVTMGVDVALRMTYCENNCSSIRECQSRRADNACKASRSEWPAWLLSQSSYEELR